MGNVLLICSEFAFSSETLAEKCEHKDLLDKSWPFFCPFIFSCRDVVRLSIFHWDMVNRLLGFCPLHLVCWVSILIFQNMDFFFTSAMALVLESSSSVDNSGLALAAMW